MVEIPAYKELGNYLIGKKFKGIFAEGRPAQEYIVRGWSLYGDAEDLLLRADTGDGRDHRIGLTTLLKSVCLTEQPSQSAQTQPKLPETQEGPIISDGDENMFGPHPFRRDAQSQPKCTEIPRAEKKGGPFDPDSMKKY